MLTLSYNYLSLAILSDNVYNVSFDGQHGYSLWRVDVVPHSHVIS